LLSAIATNDGLQPAFAGFCPSDGLLYEYDEEAQQFSLEEEDEEEKA
jgi:hypothetical protein